MRFAIAVHGTRGDVEPCAALGLELVRRGHEVRMAVPPNLVSFARDAGLPQAVAYGPDSHQQLQGEVFERPDALTAATPADWLRLGNPVAALRKARAAATAGWPEINRVLLTISDGADAMVSGTAYQELVANVAEYQRIPLAQIHYFPVRANSAALPIRLPRGALTAGWAAGEWSYWRLIKPAEDIQRRALGLRPSTTRSVRRIAESGALEIQAYDPVFFPGLAAEWAAVRPQAAQWAGARPLIGSLTLQQPTDVDDEVAAWISAGPPPIYFGFGSMPVENPGHTLEMVTRVCAELGERALICSGATDFGSSPAAAHVHLVESVNHAAVFPACRAVVHHGGAGTTSAGVRAGVPALVLWVAAEQPLWGRQLTRLGIGRSRRFSATTADSLREDLRAVLDPASARRADEVSARMIPAARSVATAADLIERQAG